MASFKSAAVIGLLACVLGVPKSVAGNAQWPQWPPPEQPDQTAEEARWAGQEAWRAAQDRQAEARQAEQNWRAQQQARWEEETRRNFEAAQSAMRKFFGWDSDPFERTPQQEYARREAELRAAEENFREMNDAAAELADLSERINRELNGGQQVMSKRMLKDLDRLEKLAKKVRDRGKRLPKNPI